MYQNITFEKEFELANGQTIGYTYVPRIPGYGARLYLQRGYGIATELIKDLNEKSIWGGYDKDGENFLSWEFPLYTYEEDILKVLKDTL